MINKLIFISIIMLASALSAQENFQTPYFEKPVDAEKYLLQPGDELTVTFIRSDLKELKLKVNAEGELVNQQLGVINVSGMKLWNAKSKILEALNEVFNTKEMQISVDKPRMTTYTVRGAVRNPGLYRSYNSRRVSDIITDAGGILEDASSRNIILSTSQDNAYRVDLDKAFYLGELSSDPLLYAGNDIYVPAQNEQTVQVTGEVNNPREVELLPEDNISILISLAGGMRSRADSTSVFVIRQNKRMVPTVLEAGDIISVPYQQSYVDNNSVKLFGAVKNPGKYEYNNGMTLGNLLTQANLEVDDGNVQLTTIFRSPRVDLDGRLTDIRFPISFSGRDDQSILNAKLQVGDSVFVPVAVGYVKISGEIYNPGYVPFIPNQSVEYYLNTVGGVLPSGDVQHIHLYNPVSKLTTIVSTGVSVPDGCELVVQVREELQ